MGCKSAAAGGSRFIPRWIPSRAMSGNATSPGGMGDVAAAPEVAVGAICVRDGRLLLVRRARPPSAGRWAPPGGRVEPGERLADAVRRELAEETGLDGVVGELCGIAERIGQGHHHVIHDFWVEPGSLDPVADDDAEDVAWADRADLDRLPLAGPLAGWLREHGVLDLLR